MYTKLANSILTSTVWMESDQTRIVWLTLLAMCDKNGEVQASIPGLANVARVPLEACEAAISLFLSPDPYSRTKTDEGRRIEEIDGGWSVLNHEKYRDLASDSDTKRKAAQRQHRYRERLKRNCVTVTRDAETVTRDAKSVTGCDKSRQFSHTDTDAEANTSFSFSGSAIVVPKKMQTPEVQQAVSHWLTHLESKDPLKVPQADSPQMQALWHKWSALGPERLVAAIWHSSSEGFMTLHEPPAARAVGASGGKPKLRTPLDSIDWGDESESN